MAKWATVSWDGTEKGAGRLESVLHELGYTVSLSWEGNRLSLQYWPTDAANRETPSGHYEAPIAEPFVVVDLRMTNEVSWDGTGRSAGEAMSALHQLGYETRVIPDEVSGGVREIHYRPMGYENHKGRKPSVLLPGEAVEVEDFTARMAREGVRRELRCLGLLGMNPEAAREAAQGRVKIAMDKWHEGREENHERENMSNTQAANTQVTRFEVESTDDGIEATVTVARRGAQTVGPSVPEVADLPTDIRAALWAWLVSGGEQS